MTCFSGKSTNPRDERRDMPRHAFGVVQPVANSPSSDEQPVDTLKRVQILELSQRGFSYYAVSAPETEELVVVLGQGPDAQYLPAQVVNARMMEEAGHIFYRVGCRFVGDVPPDTITMVLEHAAGPLQPSVFWSTILSPALFVTNDWHNVLRQLCMSLSLMVRSSAPFFASRVLELHC